MVTLDWSGKRAVVNHHLEVRCRLLRRRPELSVGGTEDANLLIEGDNLHALKALLPYYAGQVKCIYIDPPYNTGNEKWAYNDNVKAPEIARWLGQVVGGEGETLDRHDRWLCMMYPRLRLLHELLREDGVILISIDDNEIHNLRHLMDEAFGPRNFVVELCWQKRVSPANDAKFFSSDHEYILVYAKNKEQWRPNRLPRTPKQMGNYRNLDNDPRGPWNSVTYTCNKTADERPNLYHPITNPHTGETIWPKRSAVWKYDTERHRRHEQEGLIWWGKHGKAKMPRLKKFLEGARDVVPRSVLLYDEYGHTQEARSELLDIIEDAPFATPKPSRLLTRLLQVCTDRDSLVLDSFAGSGTTGHAVLKLNAADGGNRRFILVEMEASIAREITAERLKRVIEGHGSAPGLGGGFSYCALTEPMFEPCGRVCEHVRFADLARHVFFSETGQPLAQGAAKSPLLGEHNGTAYYLLFNGILGEKSADGGN